VYDSKRSSEYNGYSSGYLESGLFTNYKGAIKYIYIFEVIIISLYFPFIKAEFNK